MLEQRNRFRAWGRWQELQVGGGAVRKDEGWGAEDAVNLAALGVVVADPPQEGAIGGILVEPVKIEPDGGGDFAKRFAPAVVFAGLVLGD